MLKLSNRGLYGIKALYELANNYGNAPMNIREISRRHGMPVPFLEQVLHILKQKGLVNSRRGINGGYELSRPPEEISLGDAVRALEGPIALCDCIKKSGSDNKMEKELNCIASNIYRKLGEKVENAFDSVSLHELAEEDTDNSFLGTCG